ncbi:Cerato-platanin [Auricularia subglabra TFB-10046 SS5]|nr:Cerato-platanin [Auricularia subglabra TFB-10046 SS5]
MRVLAIFASALTFTGLASAAATKGSVSVSYDTVYDNSKLSTNLLACSDGKYGLATKGYKTIGALPSFPYVGGAPAIAGWNSKSCGTCWRVAYGGRNITFTAIDASKTINLSKKAMNKLTNNQAVKLGKVKATYEQVAKSLCGL